MTGVQTCALPISETILHRTKTPLTVWFWAAYLMTTDKRGLSALLLQRQLGLGNYETPWMRPKAEIRVKCLHIACK